MHDRTDSQRVVTRTIRWTARVWSITSIGLVLLLLFGEPFNPTPTEMIGLLFFPLGICAGMIVAWRREGLGGGLTVGSLLVFYAFHVATAGTLPRGWAWLVLAAPGFLFLLCWDRSRKARTVAH